MKEQTRHLISILERVYREAADRDVLSDELMRDIIDALMPSMAAAHAQIFEEEERP